MTLPLAEALLAHRARAALIDGLSAELIPSDLEAAYAVQTETIRGLGPVGAWKVSPFPSSGEPAASPLLRSDLFEDGAALIASDYAGIGIEAEVAVTLNRALPAQPTPYTPDDLHDAVGSLHLAIEVIATRYADRAKVPLLAQIADLQNGGAIVLGRARQGSEWPELGQQPINLSADGKIVESVTGGATTANVLAALSWLANHAAARGLPLEAGTVVITGARIGALPLTGKQLLVEGQGFEPVTVSFA